MSSRAIKFRAAGVLGLVAVVMCVDAFWGVAMAKKLPKGYLSEKKSQEALDKTLLITMDPDLRHLSEGEREALKLLLEVGEIAQKLYEESRHHQALQAHAALRALHDELGQPEATQNLLDLYRIFKGPFGRLLDGNIHTILPVDPKVPGGNVYPWGLKKAALQQYIVDNPDDKAALLHVRSIVRRATRENAEHDAPAFYAIPYSVAYGEQLSEMSTRLDKAAEHIEKDDADFAGYLRHRAVDLLRNDYEASDAAWVTGSFGNLNAQIGSYETYDDELYGTKSFFGVSLLAKNLMMTSSLRTVSKWLQDFEDRLPYEPKKKVRSDIPIGVYDVIADFGQARGTNTATILPNENYITRKYGRTILLRRNILQDPDLFEIRKDAFEAAVAREFHEAYKIDGDLFRTLFHEIGHYLGPDGTEDGRTLDIALEEDASILEELKSDLISLFLCKRLLKKRYYPIPRGHSVWAAGVRRMLRKSRPQKAQTYATMQLMQLNYFLEKGALSYDEASNKLVIVRAKGHETVEAMLREVLSLQYKGDKAAADVFIEKYSTWREDLHQRLADAMKKAETYRYVLVRYGLLDDRHGAISYSN